MQRILDFQVIFFNKDINLHASGYCSVHLLGCFFSFLFSEATEKDESVSEEEDEELEEEEDEEEEKKLEAER